MSGLLLQAVKNNSLDIVKVLLSNGANINEVIENGDTALTISAKSGHKDIVEFLLDKQIPYGINDNKDLTKNITKCLFGKSYGTILEAIGSDDVKIVKFFVKYGINLNTKYNKFTPLMISLH